jgi:cysteinyl-tRNA synthetase
MLRIYNSLTRTKQDFVPRVPGKVGMYVCGITVYDYCHIGHARMMVVFDTVQRWLRAHGYNLTYVRNITDIEDKIIRRAVEQGVRIRDLTERFIAAMHEDLDALRVERPDHEPRATEYVPQMLSIINRLQDRGLAYAVEAGRQGAGDVNFSVRRFPGYGRLSGRLLDDLRAGERVLPGSGKHDPLDFVLWKAAKPGEPEDAVWNSGFGQGRPGWHIECSAMSAALLDTPIDIHGGGADLQFPHHENEIAQSEGAMDESAKPFVRYWMHNGFVRVDDQKMSKSLGNFFTIREVLALVDAEVLRFYILKAHYRSPLNYSDSHLEEARSGLLRLYGALGEGLTSETERDHRSPSAAPAEEDHTPPLAAKDHPGSLAEENQDTLDLAHAIRRRFSQAMDDDFNTPVAIAALFELAAAIYRLGSAGSASDSNPAAVPEHARLASRAQTMAVWRALLRELAAHLGLLDQDLNRVRTGGLRGSGGKSESARRNALPGLEPVPAHSADQNAVHNPQHRAGHHAEHNDGYSAEQAEDWIQHLVDQRSLAKKARDFPRADALREELAQAGIVLEDSPQGTRWRRA